MKKFNVLICVLLMLFSLTACGGTEKNTEETIHATASTTLAEITNVLNSISSVETTESATKATTVTETATATTSSVATTEATTAYTTTEASTIKLTTVKVTTTTEKKTTKAKTTKPTTTKPTTTAPTTQTTTEAKKYCTVRIECNTIYDNIGKLKSGKKAFLPTSGVILGNVQVELTGGESAFDVIKKACEENVCTDSCKYCEAGGVQIEYTYTPAFNNYYIEGIHQIYEKDCGTQSGWMYSVNGTFPDVGSSSYIVSPGDTIVFAFTCNMGADIGNTY